MRFAAHLLRADLRRSWLPLVTWLLLVIVVAIIPCVVPTIARGDARLLAALDLPIGLVAMAYPLALLVLVVQIVQTHPAVGSTAFWMTRPIPPRALLASKLAFVGLAGIAGPAVVEIVQMAAHGVPWRTQAGVAIDTAVTHAFLVALLMLGAVLTASMSRFLLMAGAALVSAAVLLAVLIVVGSRSTSPPSYAGWSHIPDPTPGIVFSVVFVLGVGTALLTQYIWRSRARTVAIAGAGAAIAVLVSTAWPWPLLPPPDVAPAWAHDTAALVASVDDSAGMSSFVSAGFGGESWIGIRGPLRIEGIRADFSARAGVTEASLGLGGETLASLPALSPAAFDASGDVVPQWSIAPRAVLGVDRLGVWVGPERELPTLFFADAATVQRHAPRSGPYAGRLRIVLQRHEIEAVLPLETGRLHHRDAFRAIVDRVDRRLASVTVHVHESQASSRFTRRLHPRYTYFLRNRRLREAVPGSGHPLAAAANALRFTSFSVGASGQGGVHGFAARELSLHFAVPSGPGGERIVLDEAWAADAELVIVSTTRAGTVERELRIDDFPLAMPSRGAF